MSNIWNFFDAKYVLSTPKSMRKDRLIANFNAVGLIDFEIVDFEPSKKYNKNSKNDSTGIGGKQNQTLLSTAQHNVCDETCRNIANNMFTLAQKGYDSGCERIIIFEDDARFSIPFPTKKLTKAIKWLATHEWDIFYLGYCQWPKLVSWVVTSSVVKLTSPLCLHGYCLSRSGMEKVLKMKKYYNISPQHVDKLYGQKDWKKYGIFPAICFQEEAPALYKKAIEKFPVDIQFKSMSRFTEYSSVLLPFIIIIIVIFIIIHSFSKK